MWLSEWLKKRNTALSESAGKRFRILAVSISLDDIFLLEYLGNQHGWETKFAGSPQEAFKLVPYGNFDLILCDRNQPGHPWREVMDRLAAAVPAVASCWSHQRMTTTCGGTYYITAALTSWFAHSVKRSFCAQSILRHAASAPWLVIRQASVVEQYHPPLSISSNSALATTCSSAASVR